MPIQRFIWTTHANNRCAERLIDHFAVERIVCERHDDRDINPGRADWLVRGLLIDGRRLEVIYDHPVGHDHKATRIVSVWDF